jgi:hypothetical protein
MDRKWYRFTLLALLGLFDELPATALPLEPPELPEIR